MAELPLDAIEQYARTRDEKDCKAAMLRIAKQAEAADGGMVAHYQAQYDVWAQRLAELEAENEGKEKRKQRGQAMKQPVGNPKNQKKKPAKKA